MVIKLLSVNVELCFLCSIFTRRKGKLSTINSVSLDIVLVHLGKLRIVSCSIRMPQFMVGLSVSIKAQSFLRLTAGTAGHTLFRCTFPVVAY